MNPLEDDEDLDITIDLTPLIDVLFIFLLFFILTASFAQPMLDMSLPQAENSTPQHARDQDIILRLKEGVVYRQNEPIEDLPVFFENLKSEGKLIFQIDAEEGFSHFLRLIDAAKGAGRDDFTIQTDHP